MKGKNSRKNSRNRQAISKTEKQVIFKSKEVHEKQNQVISVIN
jgi:hypothetical protein